MEKLAIPGTGKKNKARSFLQILTAYSTESGVTLSQESISYEDKTNEIPVFQSMIDNLDVKGKTITADAMRRQKDTCKKIVDKGGDYAFGVKGSQRKLFEDVKLFLTGSINQEEIKTFETIEKNGGRIEKRVCVASDNVYWIPDLPLWSGLNTIFLTIRTITTKDKTTEETGFYTTVFQMGLRTYFQ